MADEPSVQERLAMLAPDLVDANLRQAAAGAHKNVWFVGAHHVMRIARDERELAKLRIERRLLELMNGRLGSVPVPQLERVTDDEMADLCRKVPGWAPGWREWLEISPDVKAALAAPMGEAMGALHEFVRPSDLADLGLVPHPLASLGWLDDLRGRTGAHGREALIDRLIDRDGAPWPRLEPVVLHGDLGLNNVAIDSDSGELLGVFDFGEACLGDPHLDLRYDPTFEAGGPGMRPSYKQRRGVALLAERVAFFHAVSALHNLRISIDHEPPELLAVRRGWVDAVAAWDPARYSPP